MPNLFKLKGGQFTDDKRLDRLPPKDWKHVEAYPLRYADIPETPTPVVLGIDWYENFDTPERVGRSWYIGRDLTKLGNVRGGHAICAKPYDVADSWFWYQKYDQGHEGACVGFSSSRCMSLLNRVLYDAPWLYHEAQKHDSWPGEDYEGTEVRAAMEVLRTEGHKRMVKPEPELKEGIQAYRWATDANDVHKALGMPARWEWVPLLNSWGVVYPKTVRLPLATLQFLLDRNGEAAVPTDR